MRSRRMSLLIAVGSLVCLGADGGSIWIEAEQPARKDVTRHNWYDVVKKEGLSGGEWLSHYDGNKRGSATYEFSAGAGASIRSGCGPTRFRKCRTP